MRPASYTRSATSQPSYFSYSIYFCPLSVVCSYLSSMQGPQNRLSVDIIPDQSLEAAEAFISFSQWLSGRRGEYVTRTKDNTNDAKGGSFTHTDAEGVIANEVADWLQSQMFDDFWMSTTRQTRPVSDICQQIWLNYLTWIVTS